MQFCGRITSNAAHAEAWARLPHLRSRRNHALALGLWEIAGFMSWGQADRLTGGTFRKE